MRELIRHILKENRLQQEIKQFIEDNNIFDAAEMVGGVNNLKNIFKDDLELSEILDKLTGVVDFEYHDFIKDPRFIVFPIKYEIIGIKKNIWGTHSWPELNLIYDDSKLTSAEKKKLITILAAIQNDNTVGKIETNLPEIRNSGYFDVKQINGKDVDIHDVEFPFSKEDVKRIHNKLYGESESLNESDNREIDKNLRAINVLLSLVSWDGLCDIWAEYNPDDKEYEIRSKTTARHFYNDEVPKELSSLEDSIKSMGIKVYIYAPWFVDNCDDEVKFMNESSNENKSEDKKLNLVKEMIYSFFDEVEFIEVDTNYEGKPLIKIYHDVEDTAANYDNWLQHQIRDKIQEITGDGIILSPWWAPKWDIQKKLADFFIDVEKIEYDDEGNVINESDESKQERKFNKLVQKIENYLNSNKYPSVKKFTVYYEDTHDDVIVNIFYNVEDSIRLGGGINSVIKRVGKQVMEDLEVFPMDFKYYIHFDRDINESENKKSNYLDLIKKLVEPFKNEVGVCDIKASYDDDDDMYSVYIVTGLEEMNDKFFYVPMIQSHISKLRINVKTTIKDYLPIDNLYVGSYGKPNCKWNSINESDNKEQSLQKLIEQYGLYEFIKMTGLDFNQVKSIINKMGNPKELLKQYIREFVLEHGGGYDENYGSIFAVQIPLSDTKYVEDILVHDEDSIAVEMWEYHLDEYGHREQKDQYLTTINNLTNDELLSIISWMMEVIEGGNWD